MNVNKETLLLGGLVFIGFAFLAVWRNRASKVVPIPKSRTPMKDRLGELWNEIEEDIPYNPNWDRHSSTGQIKNIHYHSTSFNIPIGGRVRSVDPEGRRVIIIGTHYGVVGFYEQSPPVSGIEAVIIRDDSQRELRSVEHLNYQCGEDYNIGTMFETLRTPPLSERKVTV